MSVRSIRTWLEDLSFYGDAQSPRALGSAAELAGGGCDCEAVRGYGSCAGRSNATATFCKPLSTEPHAVCAAGDRARPDEAAAPRILAARSSTALASPDAGRPSPTVEASLSASSFRLLTSLTAASLVGSAMVVLVLSADSRSFLN